MNRKEKRRFMAEISQSVTELVEQLGKLPGIGKKTAERLAYHLLRVHVSEALALSDAIRRVRENVRYCSVCFNLSESDRCGICEDARRDQSLLCIVEQPRDLIALEQAGVFRGLYHVLLGRIAPLDGIGPEQLTIDPLIERVKKEEVTELVFALNPNIQGDTTIYYIQKKLAKSDCMITTIARGIAFGGELEYADEMTLGKSISNRQPIQQYIK